MKSRVAFLIVSFFLLTQNVFAQSSTTRFPKQQYGRQKAKLQKAKEESLEQKKVLETPKRVQENSTSEPEQTTGFWTLEKCIRYAVDNNLELSESELNQRMQELTLAQSKASRWPSLNSDMSLGNSYGRSIDPTSNQFVNKGFLFNNMSVNSQVMLFGWFRKRREIEQNEYSAKAANEVYAQLKDNIALNVANGYLRTLLAKEQVKVSIEQLNTDQAQLRQTRQFVKAGKLPQLNLEQMRAQVASDSSNLISATSEVQLALLQLRALLNLNYQEPFEIATPDLNDNSLYAQELQKTPAEIYEIAQVEQHRMRAQYLNIMAAQKGLEQAQASKYPTLFLGGNLSSSYSSQFQEVTGQTVVGQQQVGSVTVAGNDYPINSPVYDFTRTTVPYGSQLESNIRSNVALTVNIPIFNGYQVKTNVERARIGLYNQRVALKREQQNLQQEIYTAALQAQTARQKYMAAQSTERSARRAQDFAIKRYNIGMLPTFEYTQTQNNYNQASYNTLAAKYEMLFKMKVLDFYIGKPIKL